MLTGTQIMIAPSKAQLNHGHCQDPSRQTIDPMVKPGVAYRVMLGEMEELSEHIICPLNIKITQTEQTH
eukprot:10411958-Ditylum_brightwellii.AAC.1